jgi:hypothetical protein
MTLSLDGTEIGEIIEVVTTIGSILGMLLIGLLVYLIVRPPRHVRERRSAERRGEPTGEIDRDDAEELGLLIDRMAARLEVLERALADQLERPATSRRDEEQDLAPVEDRVTGRKE